MSALPSAISVAAVKCDTDLYMNDNSHTMDIGIAAETEEVSSISNHTSIQQVY